MQTRGGGGGGVSTSVECFPTCIEPQGTQMVSVNKPPPPFDVGRVLVVNNHPARTSPFLHRASVKAPPAATEATSLNGAPCTIRGPRQVSTSPCPSCSGAI